MRSGTVSGRTERLQARVKPVEPAEWFWGAVLLCVTVALALSSVPGWAVLTGLALANAVWGKLRG